MLGQLALVSGSLSGVTLQQAATPAILFPPAAPRMRQLLPVATGSTTVDPSVMALQSVRVQPERQDSSTCEKVPDTAEGEG